MWFWEVVVSIQFQKHNKVALHHPSLECVALIVINSLDNTKKSCICCQMLAVDDADDIPDMLAGVHQAYLHPPAPGSDTSFPEPDPDFPEVGTPLEIDTGFPEPDPDYPEDDPYAVVPEDPPAPPTTTVELHCQYLNSLPDPNVDESINF
jgi:hypothetical protein